MVAYFIFTIKDQQRDKTPTNKKILQSKSSTPNRIKKLKTRLPMAIPLLLVGSCIGMFLGAKYTIDSVIKIAEILKIGKEIVAVSAVAIGTSLPELIVSIVAVSKKKYDMVFGNIAGSNIFNIFAVVGFSGIFAGFHGEGLKVSKMIHDLALPFMIGSYFLFFIIMIDKKISRMEGFILLLCYVLFIGKLFMIF